MKVKILVNGKREERDYDKDRELFEKNNIDIGSNVSISSNVSIGSNVSIDSGSWIGSNVSINSNVSLGSNSSIHPNVIISSGVIIGSNVRIHFGVEICSGVEIREIKTMRNEVIKTTIRECQYHITPCKKGVNIGCEFYTWKQLDSIFKESKYIDKCSSEDSYREIQRTVEYLKPFYVKRCTK